MIILNPGHVTLAELERIYRSDEVAKLNPDTAPAIRQAAARVAQIVESNTTVYGINTVLGSWPQYEFQPMRLLHCNAI